MTVEQKKAKFWSIFDRTRLKGLTFTESWDEKDLWEYEQVFGEKPNNVRYTVLSMDYKDDIAAGEKFIERLNAEQLEELGFKPYLGKLDKDYMRCLLHNGSNIQIRFEML